MKPITGVTSEAKERPTRPGKRSFFTSLALGIGLFILALAALEALAHTPYIDRIFKTRSVGSYHSQFEIKWFALQDYVEKNHGVDVILLGNSMVNTGIDPAVFEETYSQLSGEKLRVFNFGVEGLTVEPLSVIAKIINQRYHPGTIILFTEMRDYIAGNGNETARQFMDTPWIRQQLGFPSVEGYLEDHTSSFKYLLALRNWSSSSFLDDLRTTIYREGNVTPEGYEPENNPEVFDPTPPSITDPKQKELFDLAANFAIAPSRAMNLRGILSLQTNDVHVIVTEMPLYPTYFVYFGPESVRTQYLQDLTSLIDQAGGAFVSAVPYDKIPLSGRMDDHHLNVEGAPIFSRLLAEELFTECEKGVTCLQPASVDLEP